MEPSGGGGGGGARQGGGDPNHQLEEGGLREWIDGD